MKTCKVCGYYKIPGGEENVSFHVFPKNEVLRQRWIEVIGLENLVPTKSSVLCSQHFSPDCFYYPAGGSKLRKYLKPGSVPTVFDKGFSRKLKIQSRLTDENHNSDYNINKSLHVDVTDTAESSTHKKIYADDTVISINRVDTCEIESEDIDREIPETPKRKWARVANPRYVGDCTLSDFQTPRRAMRNWKIAISCINSQRKRIKTVVQKNKPFDKEN